MLGNHSLSEIIKLLVERYKSIHINCIIDWKKIVETLGSADQPKETIQNVVDVQQEYFPNQCIVWDTAIENSLSSQLYRTFQVLFQFSISDRVKGIGLKRLRDGITSIAH